MIINDGQLAMSEEIAFLEERERGRERERQRERQRQRQRERLRRGEWHN